MAELFVRHLEEMEVMALGLEAPFLAVVTPDGIEIIYPRPEQ